MLLGSLLLFQGEGIRVSYGVIGGATVVTAGFFILVIGAGVRAQRRPVQSGAAGMAGQTGRVVERTAPDGRVELAGVYWSARSREPLDVGTEIEVIAVDGITVEVRRRT
jgi:membrane-bound serine protease (ClpP class)